MKQVRLEEVNSPDQGGVSTAQTVTDVKQILIGEIISDTFKAFAANFLSFGLIAIFAFVPMVIWVVADTGSVALLQGDVSQFSWANFALVIFGSIIFGQLADAAIITGAVGTLAGDKVGLFHMVRNGFARALPVILCAVLVSFIISLASMLLLIPGLMAMTIFAVAIPAVVVEGKGALDGLERSQELTSGNRWQVFWVIILIGLLNYVIGLVVGLLGNLIDPNSLVLGIVGFFVQTAISVGLGGAYSAALYVHLRDAKEGTSVDEIAQVFA